MKTVFLLILTTVFFMPAQSQGQAAGQIAQLLAGKSFRLPENSQSVKVLGTTITDVSLNEPLHFIPRNEQATILSYVVKDSGNYLVIWKLKAMDTTTFYPNSPDATAIDSSGNAWISINGKSINKAKDFLLRQYLQATDSSLNDKISFFSLPLDCSEIAHLSAKDTLSLTVSLTGSVKTSLLGASPLPLRMLETCEIEEAEIIIIKVND